MTTLSEEYLIMAASYHESAWRTLVFPPSFQRRLIAPNLFLLGHCYELTAKAVVIRNGRQVPKSHSLWKLWHLPECQFLLSRGKKLSEQCSKIASASNSLKNTGIVVESDKDACEFFRAALRLLSALHSKETDYRLRYPAQDEAVAPVPFSLSCIIGLIIQELSVDWGTILISHKKFADDPFYDRHPY